ncbi:MAG: ubiquinone biosynthesis regulatory protein kinase UbiB [Pseudomonadota bacterium]
MLPIKRFYHILKVCIQHGLEDLVTKDNQRHLKRLRWLMPHIKNQYPELSRGERLCKALYELGPIFVKFGQMLSTRRDILPPDIVDALASLQDKVPPFDSLEAEKIIRRSLHQPFDEVFASFESQALASASIAQVHAAQLCSGEHVVVKVLRPNIDKKINGDLALMQSLANWLVKYFPASRRLKPQEVVKDYDKTIHDELDLMREAANASQLKRNFKDSDLLYVPEIHWDHCSEKVMVSERIYGIPISDIQGLDAAGVNRQVLAERGVKIFFTQVFRDSFFHADMHPGNIFVDASNPELPSYIGIDCGIIGTLNAQDQRYLAENFVAFFNRDYRKVAELHVESGWVPAGTNVEDFESAIRTACEPIFGKPLAEISFGFFLLRLFQTAQRFNMEVQPQLVLLQKTFFYIEGLGRELYPELDLWKTAKPFLEDWLKERLGFMSMLKHVKSDLPYWREKAPYIPNIVFDYLSAPKNIEETLKELKAMQIQHVELANNRRGTYLGGVLFAGCGFFAISVPWVWAWPILAGLGLVGLLIMWIFTTRT